MRVTEKGQVTIPKPIRDKLGIKPGSEVEFVERDADIVVIAVDGARASSRRSADVERWIASVRGGGEPGLSTDEVMHIMRGPFDDVDPR